MEIQGDAGRYREITEAYFNRVATLGLGIGLALAVILRPCGTALHRAGPQGSVSDRFVCAKCAVCAQTMFQFSGVFSRFLGEGATGRRVRPPARSNQGVTRLQPYLRAAPRQSKPALGGK